MAKLTPADITHVARLAKIKLSTDEVERFREQLSEIVDYISELEQVDTTNIDPTSQTTGLTNMLRQDKVDLEQGLAQDEALSGTENLYNGYFIVPAVLDKNDNS